MIKVVLANAFVMTMMMNCQLSHAFVASPPLSSSLAFIHPSAAVQAQVAVQTSISNNGKKNHELFSSSTNDSNENSNDNNDEDDREASKVLPKKMAAAAATTDVTSDVPINVPSPILLSSSMILAIASTGSVFELAGGNASIPTIGISVVGIPLCFFLFYAAIKKGIAETEADDAEYQRKNNRF